MGLRITEALKRLIEAVRHTGSPFSVHEYNLLLPYLCQARAFVSLTYLLHSNISHSLLYIYAYLLTNYSPDSDVAQLLFTPYIYIRVDFGEVFTYVVSSY